jgi:lipopolysaccharide/colanic/teichoic acid biosynthesis glycosyltransferase
VRINLVEKYFDGQTQIKSVLNEDMPAISNFRLKSLFDSIASFFGLIILSPILLLIALLIKFDSPGPIFYLGERIGLGGKKFKIFKFRTMVQDAERIGASSTSEEDPRISNIGRILRKYKLDEFPQLINVLLGDMSIVGPRPEVRKFVDLYTDEERRILTVKPGITDWASLKFDNEGEIIKKSGIEDYDEAYAKLIRPEKLKLQLKYVDNHNFLIDIEIIFRTLLKLIATRLK